MANKDLLEKGTVIFSEPEYDKAIIGTTGNGRAVYSYELMIKCLVEQDGMEPLEAAEFIDYNAVRALPYIKNAPVIVYALEG